jgi:RNA-directed DNA polymerase
MLTALEGGVKGNVWFRLIDKVFSERNLLASAAQVVGNKGAPGVDHVTVDEFQLHLDANVRKLSDDLRQNTYCPHPIRRTFIPKPGTREQRPLGIPTVRDRVVQAAVVHVLEPIFEKEFAEQSYGFRPGRSCKDALRRVDELLKRGYVHVVDVDLKSYFDTIPHEPLLARLRERVADGRVLALVESFLKAGVMSGWETYTPEEGAPQGAVLSPLLSNVYLNPLDHLMAARGFEMVRYADDFVILCRSAEEAEQALALVRDWTAQAGLTVHPTKTRVIDIRREGFDFLGYHFQTVKNGRIRHWPRKKSLAKLKDTLRKKTGRSRGDSLAVIIQHVNQSLRGWFQYFQHSYYNTFPRLDEWIRGRLRSILRKRRGLRGRGRGSDHHRWPIEFFTRAGLLNLTEQHRAAVQPCFR